MALLSLSFKPTSVSSSWQFWVIFIYSELRLRLRSAYLNFDAGEVDLNTLRRRQLETLRCQSKCSLRLPAPRAFGARPSSLRSLDFYFDTGEFRFDTLRNAAAVGA